VATDRNYSAGQRFHVHGLLEGCGVSFDHDMGAKYAKLPLIKTMPPFNSSLATVCLKVEVFQPISFRQRNMSTVQQIRAIVMVNSTMECACWGSQLGMSGGQ
jgi:hypothetical protein